MDSHDKEVLNYEFNEENAIYIILAGVTGSGKSATGNSILGYTVFPSCGGLKSVTRDWKSGHSFINGHFLKVVDIPGFNDTEKEQDDKNDKLAINSIIKAFREYPSGLDSILLALPYSSRITNEQSKTLNYIVDIFGTKNFKSHGIILITKGDDFEHDNRHQQKTIKEWVDKLPSEHKKYFEYCDFRYFLLNNRATGETMEKQMNDLILLISQTRMGKKRIIPEIAEIKAAKAKYDDDKKLLDARGKVSNQLGFLRYKVTCLCNEIKNLPDEDLKSFCETETKRINDMTHLDLKQRLDLIQNIEKLKKDRETESLQQNLTQIINDIDNKNAFLKFCQDVAKKIRDSWDKLMKTCIIQ